MTCKYKSLSTLILSAFKRHMLGNFDANFKSSFHGF
jgi:hypothetical protein